MRPLLAMAVVCALSVPAAARPCYSSDGACHTFDGRGASLTLLMGGTPGLSEGSAVISGPLYGALLTYDLGRLSLGIEYDGIFGTSWTGHEASVSRVGGVARFAVHSRVRSDHIRTGLLAEVGVGVERRAWEDETATRPDLTFGVVVHDWVVDLPFVFGFEAGLRVVLTPGAGACGSPCGEEIGLIGFVAFSPAGVRTR
jgi:hypothetical protein